MKYFSILFFLFASYCISYGQGFFWAKSNSSTGNVIAKSVFVDGAGGVYVVGTFEGTTDLDPGPAVLNYTAVAGTDIFIQKFNAAGTLLFVRVIGGSANESANDVVVDPNSNIYVTGSFGATVDFDPGAGVSNLTSAGGLDIFILRLTSAGNWSYSARIGGTGDDQGLTVCANAGAFAIGGTFIGNNIDFDPGAGVANLSSSGTTAGFMTRYTVGTSFTFATLMGGSCTASEMDASGNIYSTGALGPILNVGGTTLGSLGGVDIYVSKMTAAGANVWAKAMGSAAGESGFALAVDASSNVYTSGFFSGTADFDPGAGSATLTSGGSNDIFVSKLDASGNYSWARSFPGVGDDRGIGIDVDLNGNVYTVGYFRNTVDFDPGAGTANLVSAGIVDGFVSKLDPSGNYVWAQSISSASSEAIYNVYVDAPGNIHFCGYYSSTCDFDPTGATFNLTSAGNLDGGIAKWAPCAVPAAPTNTTPNLNPFICAGQSTSLSVSGTATIGWYDALSGGNYLGGGSSLNTGALGTTTTYYAQDSACAASARTAITVYVGPAVANQTVSAANATVCPGQSTNINLASSETGVSYFLRDDFNNSVVAGPITGTGSGISLPTGALTNTTTFNVNAISSLPNYAVNFDGVNDFVSLGTSNRGLGNTLTVTARVRTTASGTYKYIATKYNGTNNGFILYIDVNGKAKMDGRDGGGGYKTTGPSTTTVTDNQWHDITGVVRSTGWEIYVDGVLESTGTYALGGGGLGTATEMRLASLNTEYSAVQIDYFAMWNAELSPASILSYTATCLQGNEANLIAYMPLNEGLGTVANDFSPSALNGTLTNLSVPACWIAGSNQVCANGCELEMSNTVTVTVSAAPATPTITAGGPTTFCTGGSVTLTSSPGTSYLWSTGATSASINVTTSGTYTVQVTNAAGCQSAASSGTVVTVSAPPSTPTISAGGPTTFCAGGSVTLTSSAGSSYLWSNGATTASINVTTAGTYTVQVTSGGGCLSAASSGTTVTVNVLPTTPTISAGGSTTFCAGGSVTLTSSAGSSYLWSNGATTSSINVTTAGTYTVQVTNANGCQSAASSGTSVTVNALPATPTVTAGGPTTFCSGGSVTLTSSPGSTYLWSNGATTASINVTTSGNYSVQVTNAAGCQSTASSATPVTVNALPSTPTISAGGSTTFCAGGSVTLTASAGSSYLWSNGATTSSINVTTAGTYTVQVTNGNGCQSAASSGTTVTVNALPATPTISAGGPTTFCAGGSVTLTSTPGSSYLWSNGATSASINVTTAGTYTVQVSNAAGCQSTASAGTSVTVNSLPAAPTISASGPTTFCSGGSVTLTSTPGSSYLWSNGSTSASINVNSAGTYTVQVTNAAGCQSPASSGTTVIVNPLPAAPTISASGSTTICDGETVTLTSSAGSAYLWSNGSSNASINVNTAGTYSVQVTDANGCQSLSSVGTIVTVNPLPVINSGTVSNPVSCVTNDGSIEVSGSGTGDLTWSGAATGNVTGISLPYTINSLGQGTYLINFTDANGCTSLDLSVTLTAPGAPSAPTASAAGPLTFCDGGSVVLNSTPGDIYLWSNGETTQSITVTTAGTYSVTVTDLNGCTSPTSNTLTVTVDPQPDMTISVNANVLTANQSAASYQWVDCNNGNAPISGATGQTFTPTANGSYACEITLGTCTELSACTTISTIGLHETKLEAMYIYPNPTQGMLHIESELENLEGIIYNATGMMVQRFIGNKIDVSELPSGTYFLEVRSEESLFRSRFVKN